DLAALLFDVARQALDRRSARGALFLEDLGFARLVRLVGGKRIAAFARLLVESLELVGLVAQLHDHLGARLLDVAVVRQVARNRRSVAPLEKEPQPVGCPLSVLETQEPLGERLLPRGAIAQRLVLVGDGSELGLDGAAILAEVEERSMRLAQRFLALLELLER